MALLGIFGNKKAETNQAKIVTTHAPVKVLEFTSSTGFRGYKRTNISTYSTDCPHWQKNVDKLVCQYGTELVNLPVKLEIRRTTDNRLYALTILDSLEIGAFYDSAPYSDEIINGKIAGIHFRNEIEIIVTQEGVTPRNKIRVFVKLN